ncbi:DUF418 domain-containing protein [Lysinibacillus sphaericus]|uniref:DUF418 domain-containing protein n=1 Tax=Lysinibacillus sphaericus TaxID=1421 RepID=UPI003F7A3F39
MHNDVGRIYSIDIIRGLAIMGIFLININSFISEEAYRAIQNSLLSVITGLFVHGKFHFIFAFLFGVGANIFLSRLMNKDLNNWCYIRRMILLLVFGIVNLMLSAPDVLVGYAILGTLILPLIRLNRNFIFGCALFLTLFVDIYTVVHHFTGFIIPNELLGIFFVGQTLGHMLLGYILFDLGLFDLKTKKPLIQKIFISTCILSICVLSLQIIYQLKFTLFSSILGLMYITGILLVLEYKKIYKLCKNLVSYGRMSLTNYIMQSVFGILIIASVVTTIKEAIICSILIYTVQIIFSNIWMKYFNFGPLEWLWRMGTYLTIPKFRK